MSLINDALKKAQRERDQPPSSGGVPNVPLGGTPSSGSPSPGKPWWAILLVIVVVSVLSAWVTGQFLRNGGTSNPPTPAPVVAAAPQSASVVTATTLSPASTVPAVKPSPTAAPLRASATPVPALVVAPAAPEPIVLSAAAEQARKLLLVNQLRVSGVRLTERGNRALINDRLVKVGDTVDAIPGLKVVEIERERIVLTDEGDHRYVKRLQ